MKKLFWLTGLLLGTTNTLTAQTLFNYGNHAVNSASFIRAYNKNNNGKTIQDGGKEYLDLYINYKLRVQAAKDAQLDTIPQIIDDLDRFKREVASNYFNSEAGMKTLKEEALKRKKQDILVQKIFVPFESIENNARQKALLKINEAYKALAKESFEQVLVKYDGNAANIAGKGMFGWVTVFNLPYDMENAIYSLQDGQYSKPVEGSKGYYIFKRLKTRPAAGKVTIAQILIPNRAVNDPEKKIEEAYNRALKGESFEKLVAEYSYDRLTNNNAGLLSPFGIGTYASNFEENAFGLNEPGELTKPFETESGWHILKLIRKNTFPDDLSKNEEEYRNFEYEFKNAARLKDSKKRYLEMNLTKLGFTDNVKNKNILWNLTSDLLKNGVLDYTKYKPYNNSSVLFTFGNHKTSLADWEKYIKNGHDLNKLKKQSAFDEEYHEFVLDEAEIQFIRTIEKTDAASAALISDFSDDNLSFEILDRNIWQKVQNISDPVLKAFYTENISKYVWQNSADVLLITVIGKQEAEKVYDEIINKGKKIHELLPEYPNRIMIDSSRYEYEYIPLTEKENIKTGYTSQVKAVDDFQNQYLIVQVLKTYPQGEQKTFDEAKGAVISDYQNQLEQNWLKDLKKKYPVKVNEAEVKKLFNK